MCDNFSIKILANSFGQLKQFMPTNYFDFIGGCDVQHSLLKIRQWN